MTTRTDAKSTRTRAKRSRAAGGSRGTRSPRSHTGARSARARGGRRAAAARSAGPRTKAKRRPGAATSRGAKQPGGGPRRWSQHVTETSNAMDLDPGVFELGARDLARSLKRSAERSHRRKSPPYRSAMSMLTFYENRAGKHLSPRRRATLEAAKRELRKLFGREK